TAAANNAVPGNMVTALGYGEVSAIGAVRQYPGADSTSILVRYTFAGDANLDGSVNSVDFNLLAANFGASGSIWTQGDFNYDDSVNALDFNLLATNFGSALWANPLGATVPEPGALLIFIALALPLAALIRRRPSNRAAVAKT